MLFWQFIFWVNNIYVAYFALKYDCESIRIVKKG